jgi:hypothetical protein
LRYGIREPPPNVAHSEFHIPHPLLRVKVAERLGAVLEVILPPAFPAGIFAPLVGVHQPHLHSLQEGAELIDLDPVQARLG